MRRASVTLCPSREKKTECRARVAATPESKFLMRIGSWYSLVGKRLCGFITRAYIVRDDIAPSDLCATRETAYCGPSDCGVRKPRSSALLVSRFSLLVADTTPPKPKPRPILMLAPIFGSRARFGAKLFQFCTPSRTDISRPSRVAALHDGSASSREDPQRRPLLLYSRCD